MQDDSIGVDLKTAHRILDYVAEVNCDESTEDPVVLDGNDVEQLLRVQSAFSDITLEAASATRIEFDRSGRPVNSVQIDVKKGGATYASVTMNNLGVVTTTYVDDFF